jgi:hypothetical protein
MESRQPHHVGFSFFHLEHKENRIDDTHITHVLSAS